MSADLTWLVNGIDLDSAVGDGFLTAASSWRAPVTARRHPVTIPGRHGDIDVGLPIFEAPLVTLSVRVLHATQAGIEAMVNNLVGLLAQPNLTITRVSGGITASAKAVLVSINDDEFLVGATDRLTAVLRLPGVFLRETPVTAAAIPFATDLVSVEVPALGGGTAPIPDAVVRVTGPCTNPSVTDPGTGTGISWAGSVPAGQHLYLVPGSLSARVSSSDSAWLTGGTSGTSGVSYPAAGPLQMWPVVEAFATRRIRVSATGTGKSGATALTIRAGRCHL